MKKESLIQKTVILLVIELLLLITVLLVFLYSSYRAGAENMNQVLDNFLQIYGNELENKIENSDRLLERMVYKNTDFELLQSESESDRYYAARRLRGMLDEAVLNDNNVDMVVVAENQYQTCVEAESSKLPVEERNAIREFALAAAAEQFRKASWDIKVLAGTPFIYKMYVWRGRTAGVFVAVDSFMATAGNSELEDMRLLLADANGRAYGSYGSDAFPVEQGTFAGDVLKEGVPVKTFEVADGAFFVYAMLDAAAFRWQLKSGMIVFFVVIMMSLLFAFLLVTYIKREILEPMKHMKESMEQIKEGDYGLRITNHYRTGEFTILKDTFNRLMDEIVGLKIQSYEKQIELQETELKAIRLQIRPHFFLNAMTTISSLSMQGKNAQIKTYIDALSKNIRYMFKSGLHTVALSEEIRHVENYFEMQELKYPGSVFYCIEIERGTEAWRIPQMLIHTVIENEYKYAVAVGQMLTILIKAERRVEDGEVMLAVSVEDDGKGYPKEVLAQFESDRVKKSEDGSRVGLFSVRRMLELMYERKNLFRISNIEPHGCLNRFLIPAEPVHEVKQEHIQNKLE